MNLRNKKNLAARTLGVGKERIIFVEERISDIKEAISKQDIKDLMEDGAIIVKTKSGRRRNVKRKRRGPGKIKKKVNLRKREYVAHTRKLRAYLKGLLKSEALTKDQYKSLRKKIRNREFRSKSHLKEYISKIK